MHNYTTKGVLFGSDLSEFLRHIDELKRKKKRQKLLRKQMLLEQRLLRKLILFKSELREGWEIPLHMEEAYSEIQSMTAKLERLKTKLKELQ
jgi:hypothetical protein